MRVSDSTNIFSSDEDDYGRRGCLSVGALQGWAINVRGDHPTKICPKGSVGSGLAPRLQR